MRLEPLQRAGVDEKYLKDERTGATGRPGSTRPRRMKRDLMEGGCMGFARDGKNARRPTQEEAEECRMTRYGKSKRKFRVSKCPKLLPGFCLP